MRISDWSSDVCSSDLPHAIKSLGSRFRGNDGKSGTAGALLMRTPAIQPDPEPVQQPVQRLPRPPQLGGRLRKHADVALPLVLSCRAVLLVGRVHAADGTRCLLQLHEDRRGVQAGLCTYIA